MAQGILVFIEERDGKVKKPSLEALYAARKLADRLGASVTALRIGGGGEASENLAAYGADRIVSATHDLLKTYSTEAFCATLGQVVKAEQPRFIFGSASSMGRDFLPRVAAKLGVGLAQDCIELNITNGQLECLRPIYAGKAYAKVRLLMEPAMATLRPNVFALGSPDAGRSAEAAAFTPELGADKVRASVKEVKAAAGQKLVLTEANISVSGGRGMKGPENFPIIEKLADALGAAVGASRAAVDAGWIDHTHQVGQTGKTVSPTLYVACGISGAIQHLAGMSSSKYIVAINKDAEAPILSIADYGIVGDLFTIVPALTEEVKKL
jgi:electron transfer flavoprotein alpha subunit